ncbi:MULTISPECIES: RagB/SusD family nutrient uptake outer membrane protein [Sphingobacterium]|uniref:RagB/SusD family nutrient uptake outer membrane protein n=1 Tax=Sphingobacterium TaxID=28453 RepID=UPI001050A472|nr:MULTISPECIES: RagB/SusD family nutrient uptake outer membrane protein [Sphingobacterium]MCW2263750.1 hypothetical protein [Sphingobacterium kitahiroshimense]TCR00629.1 SusD-like starch-binding protein associating with outer membrane [Sphingobacterium sp. JUb78]
MKKIIYHIAIWMGLLLFMSCDKFLDAKPDQKMTIPNNLADCDALLDNYSEMNSMFPSSGEAATDDLFLSDQSWAALYFASQRGTYIWDGQVDVSADEWQGSYKVILMANQVLEVLKEIDPKLETERYNRIKGSALFFRAYALLQLANIFTLPYNEKNADQILGLPLRLSPDADYPSTRASLKDTYKQILSDLNESILLLPVISLHKSRPIKSAAYATLARVGLIMGDFNLVENVANAALDINNELMDYNVVNKGLNASFERFNKEIIFDASTLTNGVINPSISKIDSILYLKYSDNDLRKVLFFNENDDGTFAFKGQYNGEVYASSFSGIATDEVYLSLAEAYARNNKVDLAMQKLNELMITRWQRGDFVPFVASSKEQALQTILEERRKELIMRNIRWMDLKRLNQENSYKKVLNRVIEGKEYILEPDDNRYAFLIPLEVMGHANLEQNRR